LGILLQLIKITFQIVQNCISVVSSFFFSPLFSVISFFFFRYIYEGEGEEGDTKKDIERRGRREREKEDTLYNKNHTRHSGHQYNKRETRNCGIEVRREAKFQPRAGEPSSFHVTKERERKGGRGRRGRGRRDTIKDVERKREGRGKGRGIRFAIKIILGAKGINTINEKLEIVALKDVVKSTLGLVLANHHPSLVFVCVMVGLRVKSDEFKNDVI
jgi:hypothetical protein